MTNQTLGTRLARALKTLGVDTVFGIPGVHNVELYRGLEATGITHILARHEQGAGFMADGYARATGKPGVAFIISGPGLTNIMTPMGQAYSDSVPMLVISSCLPLGDEMPGKLHQMRDQIGAGATVSDWSLCASDDQAALALLDRAFDEFANGRPRPKHISVPVDVLGQSGPTLAPQTVIRKLPDLDTDQITSLANALTAAQKPVFIFGAGAANASDAARAIVEKSGAACFTSYAGRGVIDDSFALNFGAALTRPDSARILASADLVIGVGTELAQVDLQRVHLGHTGQLARIDIDPMVLADAHGAELCIHADAGDALQALTAQIPLSRPRWDAAKIATARAGFRAEADAVMPGIAPYIEALHRSLPPDALIYSDMTQFGYLAKDIYPMHAPGLWHHPNGFGTLGYALPAAIGGKFALPDRPVVAIAGDYGFQYTMAELGAAAEHALALPIILWDNGKLKEIEDAMIRSQIAPNAVVAVNPDFEHLATAYRIGYIPASSPQEFQSAMVQAQNADRPTLVHITPARP